jgi:hypothetical protein
MRRINLDAKTATQPGMNSNEAEVYMPRSHRSPVETNNIQRGPSTILEEDEEMVSQT